MRPRFTAAAAVLFTGCLMFTPSSSHETTIRREFIVRNAVEAFQQYQIPVMHADEQRGRGSSGTFVVQKAWGADLIEERVTCQQPANTTASPLAGEVALRIELRLGQSMQPALMGGRTEISLLSSGKRKSHESDDIKCRLSESLAQEIFGAIDAGASFLSTMPATN